MTRNIAILVLLAVTFCIARSRADEPGSQKAHPKADAKTATKESLDKELLKGLSNDLLDGIDNLPSLKPTEKPTGDQPAAGNSKPIDGEDLGQHGEERDPIARISRQMRDVESRIAQTKSGDDTQKRQQQISDELAALIEQLKKQSQASQNPGNGNTPGSQRSKVAQGGQKPGGTKPADKPARDSSNQMRRDNVAKADPAKIREQMKQAWGNLPARIREQMLQSSVDEFLPKYELLIEKYFQRLSEESGQQP